MLSAAIAKDRTSIDTTWLMVGGWVWSGGSSADMPYFDRHDMAHGRRLGVVGWFICGYALMFGSTDQSGLLGLTKLGDPIHLGFWNILSKSGFFLAGHAYDTAILGFFFFPLVSMDATATIPTGVMAERFKFKAFCVWGFFASAILYPIYGNWVSGGGWLS